LLLPSSCRASLIKNRVAVVGGGLAGLMAARTLGEHGLHVTVYEARDEVGGRVLSNTTFSKGRITEEGAELIGSFHRTWLALAKHYGLSVISRMDDNLYERARLAVKLTLDKALSMDEIVKLNKKVETRVLKRIAELAQDVTFPHAPWVQEQALTKYDISVAEALAKYCQVSKVQEPQLWMMIEHLLVNNELSALEDMSFLGLLCKVKAAQDVPFSNDALPCEKKSAPECLRFRNSSPGDDARLMRYWNELEVFRCADGCQALAKAMAAEIVSRYKATLHLKRVVTNIAISGRGLILNSKVVTKRDGTLSDDPAISLPYEYVVLAIPPTVWKGVEITDGGKKVDLAREVGMIGMGPAVKHFSDVKQRFWVKENAAPSGGSSAIGQVWEGTDNQTRVAGQGVVLSVFAGPLVRDVPTGWRAPKSDEIEKGLRQLYRGYSGNRNKSLYSNWPKVPFIKTGYASPKPGEIFKIGRKFIAPFHERLFFAGEHTQMDFFGYMEGALLSGQRAARVLMLQACGVPMSMSATFSQRPAMIAEVNPPVEHDSPPERAHDLKLIGQVAANISVGIEITRRSIPRLKSDSQRELIRFLVSTLKFFFPRGYGRIGPDGNASRQPVKAAIRRQGQRFEPFDHRLRLYLSPRTPEEEKAGEHQRGNSSSIVLFAPRLDGETSTRASGVALHEMAHMARHMVRRLTKHSETDARRFLAQDPWRLLDLRGFEVNRVRIERHLPELLRVVPIPETARVLADSLIEETFAYVIVAIVDEAIALAVSKDVSVGFSAETLIRGYVLHRYDVSKKQLASPAAVAIYQQMTGEVEELGNAMRTHLER
jgi:monoamine oxidase